MKSNQMEEIREFVEECREEAEELPRMKEYYEKVLQAQAWVEGQEETWFQVRSQKTGIALLNESGLF